MGSVLCSIKVLWMQGRSGLQYLLDKNDYTKITSIFPKNVRHWNTGLVTSRVSLTSGGEGASLALVGHPSSDGTTIKTLLGRCFIILTSFTPHLFLLDWLSISKDGTLLREQTTRERSMWGSFLDPR